MEKSKAVWVAIVTTVSAWLGVLAVPVYLLVAANVIDYGTGLAAAHYRQETICSNVGFRGIAKKVCMWLLVVIGVIVDILIEYAAEQAGISLHMGYAVGSLVAVWLLCNELLSILENVAAIGVTLPGFLMRRIQQLKSKVENNANAALPDKTGKEEE